MKLAIGFQIQDGPWGGGNRFVGALVESLEAGKHDVYFDLSRLDLDFIIIIDPRSRLANIPFSAGSILRYLMFRNSRAIVIHRINECDERKNTHFMNRRLRLANYCADHTVFVGEWLQKLDLWRKENSAATSVIRNGADTRIFHSQGFKPWEGHGPIRLVTHHWGGNRMKGFDVYCQLDEMLADPFWSTRVEFTYIGNLPNGVTFLNSTYVAPLNGKELANELRKHHGYLTASINEPGGNHQNEGALCGLPVLYRNSGCFPEYLTGFGQSFDGPDDFVSALAAYMENYVNFAVRMDAYPHRSERCIREWLELIDSLARDRDTIISKRRVWRDPLALFLNQLLR